MVAYRFFRLGKKPRFTRTPGRRYFRLVSYPSDTGNFPDNEAATAYAESRHFAAILCPGNQWIALTDQARQCVKWHEAGKEGYVYVF